MFERILNATLPSSSLHLHQTLVTFPGIFGNIPRNFWRHFLDCLGIFTGMFGNISWNVRRHSPEYSIPSIPRILFPVHVFLVLYIAEARSNLCTLVFSTNMIESLNVFVTLLQLFIDQEQSVHFGEGKSPFSFKGLMFNPKTAVGQFDPPPPLWFFEKYIF